MSSRSKTGEQMQPGQIVGTYLFRHGYQVLGQVVSTGDWVTVALSPELIVWRHRLDCFVMPPEGIPGIEWLPVGIAKRIAANRDQWQADFWHKLWAPQLEREPMTAVMQSSGVSPKESFGIATVLTNMDQLFAVCKHLANSKKCGQSATPESVFARVLYGAELGLPPMRSVMSIYDVNGQLTLAAGAIHACFLNKIPGAKTTVLESSATVCRIKFEAHGREPYESIYTIEEAKAAGLVKDKSGWTKHPADMLFARCLTRGVRRFAPDATNGPVYCPEEIGDGESFNTPADTTVVASREITEPPTQQSVQQPTAIKKPEPPPAPIEPAQIQRLRSLKETLGIADHEWLDLVKAFGVKSAKELTREQANNLIGQLAASPVPK